VGKFLDLCNYLDFPVLITETWRSQSEQDALYAQGRTKPGSIVTNAKFPYSNHNWGCAFDFARNVKGKEYDDSDSFFTKVGIVGEMCGLSWGGRWTSIVDKPHLELTGYGNVTNMVNKYKTFDAFKATWPKPLDNNHVNLMTPDNAIHSLPAENIQGSYFANLNELTKVFNNEKVSVRKFIELLDLRVTWDANSKSIIATKLP
jgi:peptidoglycan L-alanyl-D-glutamate endopeptidase CwlK